MKLTRTNCAVRLDRITPKIFGCRDKTHPRALRDLTDFPGGNRALEPPDPIPNSEVKWCIADDSVGSPHAKVGHRQGLASNLLVLRAKGFCFSAVRLGVVVEPQLGAWLIATKDLRPASHTVGRITPYHLGVYHYRNVNSDLITGRKISMI